MCGVSGAISLSSTSTASAYAPQRPNELVRFRADRVRRPLARLCCVPDATEPAVHPVDSGRAPRAALVPWADEHQEGAHRVGAVARDELIRRLDVAARLAHPIVVGPEYLTLVTQNQGRLVEPEQPEIAHRFDEEPEVEQVHHRVLGAAGVD